MATMGEFSSLLQLGFGIGVGLSVFRAPLELRSARLRRSIGKELNVLDGIRSPKADELIIALRELSLDLERKIQSLEGYYFPAMVLLVIGALLNLLFLIFASIDAPLVLTHDQQGCLIFVSVLYYVLILTVLDLIARSVLGPITVQFAALRKAK